eukprot:scaffold69049_cov61-Attheya_sp.AAC.2
MVGAISKRVARTAVHHCRKVAYPTLDIACMHTDCAYHRCWQLRRAVVSRLFRASRDESRVIAGPSF